MFSIARQKAMGSNGQYTMNGQIYGIIPNIDIYRNLWVDGARNLWEVMELNKCEVTAQPNEKTMGWFINLSLFFHKRYFRSKIGVHVCSSSNKSIMFM